MYSRELLNDTERKRKPPTLYVPGQAPIVFGPHEIIKPNLWTRFTNLFRRG